MGEKHPSSTLLYGKKQTDGQNQTKIVEMRVHPCQLRVISFYFIFTDRQTVLAGPKHKQFTFEIHGYQRDKCTEVRLQPAPISRQPAHRHTHTLSAGEFDCLELRQKRCLR